jgi:hypothetical protein
MEKNLGVGLQMPCRGQAFSRRSTTHSADVQRKRVNVTGFICTMAI